MFAFSWRSFIASVALVTFSAPSTMAAPSQPLAVAPRNAPPAQMLARRSDGRAIRPDALCAASGPYSFVGGGLGNVAGGTLSGVISGDNNEACGAYDAVGAGLGNEIFANGGPDDASFIGAGFNNHIYSNGFGGTYKSFIGAGDSNVVTAWEAGIGAGNANLVGTAGATSFVGGGESNTSNGEFGFVGAGHSNVAGGTEAFVGAGDHNSAQTYSGVVAGTSNTAVGPYAFVGGGQSNQAGLATLKGIPSKVGAFVGAGASNSSSGNDSFVGAGLQNHSLNDYAFVGAGYLNTAGAEYGVVAGGDSNVLSGLAGAIGGGVGNKAAGEYGTVPGGFGNSAAGKGSFAAGSASNALHEGTFVWSDGAATTGVKSSAPYQFLARASGGFLLYSNAAATAGVKLAAGSGTWASLSDRTMKSGIVPLDPASMLDKVATLPVSEWSYTSERGVRHVGPMAQDFYAAFRVGEDDRHITSIDEDGVALAAIKGLNTRTQREYDRLERENASLKNALASLKAQVAALARSTSREAR